MALPHIPSVTQFSRHTKVRKVTDKVIQNAKPGDLIISQRILESVEDRGKHSASSVRYALQRAEAMGELEQVSRGVYRKITPKNDATYDMLHKEICAFCGKEFSGSQARLRTTRHENRCVKNPNSYQPKPVKAQAGAPCPPMLEIGDRDTGPTVDSLELGEAVFALFDKLKGRLAVLEGADNSAGHWPLKVKTLEGQLAHQVREFENLKDKNANLLDEIVILKRRIKELEGTVARLESAKQISLSEFFPTDREKVGT